MKDCEVCRRPGEFSCQQICFCNDCYDAVIKLRSGDASVIPYFKKYTDTMSAKATAYFTQVFQVLQNTEGKKAQVDQLVTLQKAAGNVPWVDREKQDRIEAQNYYAEAKRQSLMELMQNNDLYEYHTEYLQDSENGMLDQRALEQTLKRYASQGWHLVSAFTNELGKNSLSVGGFGINATMDVTTLIFERCIHRYSPRQADEGTKQ